MNKKNWKQASSKSGQTPSSLLRAGTSSTQNRCLLPTKSFFRTSRGCKLNILFPAFYLNRSPLFLLSKAGLFCYIISLQCSINTLLQGDLHTGYGRFQPYAPGFKIIEQTDGKVAQLYHLNIWKFEHLNNWTFDNLNNWTFEKLNNWQGGTALPRGLRWQELQHCVYKPWRQCKKEKIICWN